MFSPLQFIYPLCSQKLLTSQDLSFVGYTYKNFAAVKGMMRQSINGRYFFLLKYKYYNSISLVMS